MNAVEFDSIKACPKCGSEDLHRRFASSVHHALCSLPSTIANCCTYEHHERYCRGCSYQWPELVLETNRD